jgi:hypothetical protein
MTTPVTVLIPAKIAVASDTTQYPSPAGTYTIIDKFTATNYDTVVRTISVNLVTSGDTAGNQNLIVKTKTLQAGETYTFPEIVGAALGPGDFISTIASNATGVNIRASGRVYS